MALGPDDRFSPGTRSAYTAAEAVSYDAGLRAYMLQVYNYMASGLALTGIVAYFAGNSPAVMNTLYAPGPSGMLQPTLLAWIVMLAPLAFVMVLSFGINRLKASTAQALFWVFAAVMGLSLANIFLIYTGASVARVFFITAGSFAALSLYGYTTKRDLSGFRSFLLIGLFGIVIGSIVNIFLQSSAFEFTISIIGVLVFAGLTAHDTQAIRDIYNSADSSETYGKKAVMGALSLYLDFINLFMLLLRLLGDRR
jgi:FtsH-binding integral membrane protein